MKYLLTIGLLLLLFVPARALKPVGEENIYRLNYSPQDYESIITRWYERNISLSYDAFFSEFVDISDSTEVMMSDIPDSVYAARLRAMVSPIYLPYNDLVKRYIIRYTTVNRNLIANILGAGQYYFPIFEQELDRAGLPHELKILAVVESALNPNAVSRAGATGLWQFMLATGRQYGLEVTSFIDQRRDPEKSTKAAVQFLSDLYAIYGDWSLAMAAYNCGPGNVNKALARAGNKAETFWDIYAYLPNETRGYVPSFIAALYAYTYHRQHGITPNPPPMGIATDTIMMSRLLHFEQISSTIDIPMEVLRGLNPQYRMDIIPAVEKSYALTLPSNDIMRYIESEEEIMSKDSLYLAQYIRRNSAGQVSFNIAYVTYVVKSGDTLGAIARRYGTTVARIQQRNNLRTTNIRIGQRLEIYQ